MARYRTSVRAPDENPLKRKVPSRSNPVIAAPVAGEPQSPPALERAPDQAQMVAQLQRTIGNQATLAYLGRTGAEAQPAPTIPDDSPVRSQLAAPTSGQALDGASQQRLDNVFAADLSDVRLHTDHVADQLARTLDARAFTVGPDIYFRAGAYQPASASGQRLLAHEVYHTLQQASGNLPTAPQTGGLRISHPADPDEQAAEHAAHLATNGPASALPANSAAPAAYSPIAETASFASPLVVQRGPDDEAGPTTTASPAKQESEPPAWSNTTPLDSLPGDPVPGYEQPRPSYTEADLARFERELVKREEENKANAGGFIGDYGSALLDLWQTTVSGVMKEAAAESGWGMFKTMLKFVAIKSLEIIAGTYLTPGAAAFFEALEQEVSEKVLEKGFEIGAAALGEHIAEKHEEQAAETDIDVTKEALDQVTGRLSNEFSTLARGTIVGLPDVTPYGLWLGGVGMSRTYWDLAKFRLPPEFPHIASDVIRATVAGQLIGILTELRPDLRAATRHWGQVGWVEFEDQDGQIEVGGKELDQAVIESPWEHLQLAIAHVLPIRALPTIPLRVTVSDHGADDHAAAVQLMSAFRGTGAVSADEIAAFEQAFGFGEPIANRQHKIDVNASPQEIQTKTQEGFFGRPTRGRLQVRRDNTGNISVVGGGLAECLYLYTWATGDRGLVALSTAILNWAQGEAAYRQEIGAEPSEDVDRLVPAADLADKTAQYLMEDEQLKLTGARALIEGHIAPLVPERPK